MQIRYARCLLLMSGFLLSATHAVHAADTKSMAASDIAGVYKTHFKNGLVDGTEYQSEDILEIVPVDNDRVYVVLDLQFYNGHVCNFAEIMRRETKNRYLYRGECELRMESTIENVQFEPLTDCNIYCGARGSLNHVSFLRKLKRPIRYMTGLKASQQYESAITADEERHYTAPTP